MRKFSSTRGRQMGERRPFSGSPAQGGMRMWDSGSTEATVSVPDCLSNAGASTSAGHGRLGVGLARCCSDKCSIL
jgi:hypothetical protein